MAALANKSYLVTGGAGAIGVGIAKAIIEQGGYVMLLDIDVAQVSSNANALGDPCKGMQCDVTNPEAARQSVAATLETFGRLDGVVNNAGIVVMNAAWDATAQDWQRHFEVNATGAFNLCQAVGEHLKGVGGGAIVNVASNCGKVGYANMAAYNASKAAVISLTRSLALEWADVGINVNAVCPGGVDTPMLDRVAEWLSPRINVAASELLAGMGAAQLGRRIQPIEVGRVIAFLLSDAAQIIRGQAISIDGGDTPY